MQNNPGNRRQDPEVLGQELVTALYATTKLVGMYGTESQVSLEAVSSLQTCLDTVTAHFGYAALRVTSETMYLNDMRVRMDSEGFMAFRHVVDLMLARNLGEMRFGAGATETELISFLTALHRAGGVEDDPLAELERLMAEAEIKEITIAPLRVVDDDAEHEKLGDLRESSIDLYFKTLFIVDKLLDELGDGRALEIRKAKRLVHQLVDILEREQAVLLGLTSVKCYKSFHATHAVNVAVLSMSLGQRLGLVKLQLADLGLSALLHDVGLAVGDESAAWDDHTGGGARKLLDAMGFSDGAVRAVLAALGHHQAHQDAEGRLGSLFHRIISACSFFDIVTSPTDDQRPIPALEAMQAMAREGAPFDPHVVKLLAAVVGAYPLGTVVNLNTGEMAVVCGRNPHFDAPTRPIVRVVTDSDGKEVADGPQLDLSHYDAEKKAFSHTIEQAYAPCEALDGVAELIKLL